MIKQNVIYSYNGILFRNKKEQTTNKHYEMDEHQIYYPKGKSCMQKSRYCINYLYVVFQNS